MQNQFYGSKMGDALFPEISETAYNQVCLLAQSQHELKHKNIYMHMKNGALWVALQIRFRKL